MHLELLKHKDQILNHEKYGADKARHIKEEIQDTTNAQVSSLLLAESNTETYEAKLKEQEETLTKLSVDHKVVTLQIQVLGKG